MAITDSMGQMAPTIGMIGGGIVGAYIGGPSGAAMGAQFGSAAGGLISAGIEAKKPIDIMGATGAEKSSALALKEMADDLRMQGGLSETEYSRMMEQINSATNTETSNIISLSRENKMSPLVLDKMVKDKLRNIAASKQKNIESLTSMDIEESRKQLSQAASVMGTANVAATNIGNIERAKEEKIMVEKEKKTQRLINSLQGVVSSSMAAYGAYSATKKSAGTTEQTVAVDEFINNEPTPTKNIDYTQADINQINENQIMDEVSAEYEPYREQNAFENTKLSKNTTWDKLMSADGLSQEDKSFMQQQMYNIKQKYPRAYENEWVSAWD